MSSVYLIVGQAGLYPEDSETWNVKAFEDKDEALAFCEACNDLVRNSGRWSAESQRAFKHPLDPWCRIIDTKTTYEVEAVDFVKIGEGNER